MTNCLTCGGRLREHDDADCVEHLRSEVERLKELHKTACEAKRLEREACAKVAEEALDPTEGSRIAKAIRDRKAE